jgi:hypothetical protein
MISTWRITKFCFGDKVWLYLYKERLQGATKKLNPLRYGPFEIIEKVNENVFMIKLPPYMQIKLVVNMEYLKLFKPSMLDEEEEHQVLPTIQDLTPHGLEELKEDSFAAQGADKLQRKARNVTD